MTATALQHRWHALAPAVAIALAACIAVGAPAAARNTDAADRRCPAPEDGRADRPSAPPALPADRAPNGAYRLDSSNTDDVRDDRQAIALASSPAAEPLALQVDGPLLPHGHDGRAAVLSVAPKTSPPHARA